MGRAGGDGDASHHLTATIAATVVIRLFIERLLQDLARQALGQLGGPHLLHRIHRLGSLIDQQPQDAGQRHRQQHYADDQLDQGKTALRGSHGYSLRIRS